MSDRDGPRPPDSVILEGYSEPGFFRTNLHASMSRAAEPIPDYDEVRAAVASVIADSIRGGGDPRQVAEQIAAIATARRPRLRYRVGREARRVPWLEILMPQAWFMAGMRRRFRVDIGSRRRSGDR